MLCRLRCMRKLRRLHPTATAATATATADTASGGQPSFLGERRWSGIFVVEDIKRRQSDCQIASGALPYPENVSSRRETGFSDRSHTSRSRCRWYICRPLRCGAVPNGLTGPRSVRYGDCMFSSCIHTSHWRACKRLPAPLIARQDHTGQPGKQNLFHEFTHFDPF